MVRCLRYVLGMLLLIIFILFLYGSFVNFGLLLVVVGLLKIPVLLLFFVMCCISFSRGI